MDYKSSGVDIDAGNSAENLIGKAVKKTYNAQVVSGVGGFGAVFSLAKVTKMKNPLLVSTVDGVGTKVKIAAASGKWDSVGADIVNHCSNDILAMGARPLFFLDYIASSKISPGQVNSIIQGMAQACKDLDCPLIGGETAEMPAVYMPGESDIAGCMIGVVEKGKMIDYSKIKPGDVMIGLQSSGLHTNGYSLARKVLFEKAGYKIDDYVQEAGGYLGEILLRVHKSYSNSVLALLQKVKVKGIAHITGGGLEENVPRILPPGAIAKYDYSSIKVPGIFKLIEQKGQIPNEEMFRVFNMGVGLVVVVSQKDVDETLQLLKMKGEEPWVLGKIVSRGK
ncbi:MAG TPA: phosphoribosylformylglycinamidine cyclo-ligase [archaeon]|nr:phosphoribosylformylglycinamidine cyclo-ligase [archaeon]